MGVPLRWSATGSPSRVFSAIGDSKENDVRKGVAGANLRTPMQAKALREEINSETTRKALNHERFWPAKGRERRLKRTLNF